MATKKTSTPATSTKSSKKTAAPTKRAAKKTVAPKVTRRAAATISADERQQLIAVAAYLRAEQRGFAPGGELEDWIVAERELDASL